MWINKYTISIAIIASMIAGAYFLGKEHERSAADAQLLDTMTTMVNRSNDLALADDARTRAHEAEREKSRVVYRTIESEVIRYVATLPDDDVCGLDADGLQLWNAANAGDADALAAVGLRAGAVPAAATGGIGQPGDAAVESRAEREDLLRLREPAAGAERIH